MSFLNNKGISQYSDAIKENGVFVTVDFSSFSGTKTEKRTKIFSDNDVEVTAVTLSPRKYLINKSSLKFVAKHYMQAKRTLDELGIQVWGGWFIPNNEFSSLLARFTAIQESYNALALNFVACYETLLQEQCDALPELAAFIRLDAPSPEEVKDRFYMKLSPGMQVTIGDNEDKTHPLTDNLVSEFSALAEDALTKLKTGDKVTCRNINCLSQIKTKATNFAFIDDLWISVVDIIEKIEAVIPKKGIIDPQSKAILTLFLSSLSNVDSCRTTIDQFHTLGFDNLIAQYAPAVDVDDNIAAFLTALRKDEEAVQNQVNNDQSTNTTDVETTVDTEVVEATSFDAYFA